MPRRRGHVVHADPLTRKCLPVIKVSHFRKKPPYCSNRSLKRLLCRLKIITQRHLAAILRSLTTLHINKSRWKCSRAQQPTTFRVCRERIVLRDCIYTGPGVSRMQTPVTGLHVSTRSADRNGINISYKCLHFLLLCSSPSRTPFFFLFPADPTFHAGFKGQGSMHSISDKLQHCTRKKKVRNVDGKLSFFFSFQSKKGYRTLPNLLWTRSGQEHEMKPSVSQSWS